MSPGRHADVHACTLAVIGYVSQARAHSGPFQDIDRCIQIAMERKAAVRTLMEPFSKLFRNPCFASRALLGRATGIHFDEAATGALCLVAQHRYEFPPRSVVHLLGKRPPCQAFDVELFYHDDVVVTHQPRTCLVQVICSDSRRSCVEPSYVKSRLTASTRTSYRPRKGALRHTQAPRGSPRRPRAWNETPIGEGSERFDAQIDANRPGACTRLRFGHINGETQLPSLVIPVKCAGAYRGTRWKRAMNMYTESARHTLETYSAVPEANARELTESKGVEPAFTAEAEKTCLAGTPYSSKERFIGVVEPPQGPPLQRHGKRRGLHIIAPPLGERSLLIEESAGNPRLSIGADAFFECGIVKLPLTLKNSLERPVLALGWQQAIAEGKDHPKTLRFPSITT